MSPKRLAVISYHTCPLSDEKDTEIGGLNVYVLELSKRLARKGFQIDIYTRLIDPESPEIVDVEKNLRVIHLRAGSEKKLSKKELLQYVPEFVESLSSFIASEKLVYDAISAHYYMSGLVGLELKEKYQLPMSITFHTLALMKNLVARDEDEKEDLARVQAEMLLVQESDAILATSEADALYLQTLYGANSKKVGVVTPGVDLTSFKPMDKEISKKKINATEDKLILFVGRIEPLKGVDVLLYALKILLQKHPSLKVCLFIVGGDISKGTKEWSRELQKLEKIRSMLQLDASVTFVGRKHREEIPAYFNAAELVVMPSHYESFGTTVLEAMACGVPVITTDAAGVSGILDKQHASLITSANNPILLSDKIRNLLIDEKAYKRISTEVYERVQDLSWEKIAEKFTKLCLFK